MNIPTELREYVQRKEEAIRDLTGHESTLETQKRDTQEQYDALCSQMGWREKYFAGRFGGDTSDTQRANDLEKTLDEYDTQIDRTNKAIQTTESNIDETIKSYLSKNDPTYQELHETLEKAEHVKDVTDTYMGKIEDALSEGDDEQGAETLDVIRGNIGFWELSLIKNSEAQEAIDEVKEYTAHFQDTLKEYNGFLKEQQPTGIENVRIREGVDFVFDTVFDGFDFMSIFTLQNLGNAESRLKELYSHVSEVRDTITEHYQKAQDNVSAYVTNVRYACRY